MLNPRFKNLKQMVSEFYESLEEYNPMAAPTPQNTIENSQSPTSKTLMVESAPVARAPVLAERAHLSKYSSQSRAIDSFRVLAGLEYREISPWNPGIVGETRTVAGMKRDFNMTEDVSSAARPVSKKYHLRPDMGGHSPKAVAHALAHSHRVLGMAHAYHSYMHDLPDHVQSNIKEKLASASDHSAYKLRGAAMGAPHDVHDKLHSLADRHERHSKIYKKGGRPKLEAIEEMSVFVESCLDKIAQY